MPTDPKDQMIKDLADQLEEAAINLKLRCGDIINYKIDLVKRAREMVNDG